MCIFMQEQSCFLSSCLFYSFQASTEVSGNYLEFQGGLSIFFLIHISLNKILHFKSFDTQRVVICFELFHFVNGLVTSDIVYMHIQTAHPACPCICKVYWCTFREKHFCHFHYCFLFSTGVNNRGQLLK